MNDFGPFLNRYTKQHFQGISKECSAVEVARLPRDVKVEIEVIAEV